MSARDDSESAAPDVPAAGVVLDKRALFELLTGAPFAVVAYEGADHVAVLSNPKHDEMTHGRVLLGRPLLASIPELAGQPAVTTLDDVYATGETKKALAMPAKLERGGSLQDCWFDVTWQPMRDGRGQISGVLVTAVEVSDHVIARRAAEEAQRKFVAIFEHAAFAIALVKMPGAVIVDVNPAWTELFGFSRQETLGKTSVEIGLRPDPEARARIWKEFVERGVVRNAENTVRAKNGKTRIISNSLDAIELDGQAYLLGTYQDVTEQREAERRLRENEHQFRGLVDNLPELAWSAEADGHIDFYNRRWYEFTGKTFEQMEGWGWKSVHDPAHVDEVVARWSQSLDSGDPFEMEFPLLGADGVFRWFLTRIRPLRDLQGKIVRWVGINTDIDQARRAQLERDALLATTQRALEVRDEFLSIAAHELRTPLTALQLQVQVSMRTVAREPSQHVALSKLESAWRQTQRLGKLVESAARRQPAQPRRAGAAAGRGRAERLGPRRGRAALTVGAAGEVGLQRRLPARSRRPLGSAAARGSADQPGHQRHQVRLGHADRDHGPPWR